MKIYGIKLITYFQVIYEIANVANNILMLVYLLNRLSLHLESWYMSRLLGLEKKKGARKLDLDENMEKWTQLRVKVGSLLYT